MAVKNGWNSINKTQVLDVMLKRNVGGGEKVVGKKPKVMKLALMVLLKYCSKFLVCLRMLLFC